MKNITLLSLIALLTVGFIGKKNSLPKPYQKDFQYVPSGRVVVENDTLTVQDFYILDHEVTNGEYRDFLSALEKSGKTELLEIAQIHDKEWSQIVAYANPMIKMYSSHSAYSNYPVVNISFEGAQLYCEWLTDQINSNTKSDVKVKVRLPQREEFIRAGAGDHFGASYSWNGQNLKDAEGKYHCNFARIPQSHLTKDEVGNVIVLNNQPDRISDGAMHTAVTKSYSPNQFKLYNMNGNVAEMLNQKGNVAGGSWNSFGYDVRLQSVLEYDKPSPTVGFRPVITVK